MEIFLCHISEDVAWCNENRAKIHLKSSHIYLCPKIYASWTDWYFSKVTKLFYSAIKKDVHICSLQRCKQNGKDYHQGHGSKPNTSGITSLKDALGVAYKNISRSYWT